MSNALKVSENMVRDFDNQIAAFLTDVGEDSAIIQGLRQLRDAAQSNVDSLKAEG